MLVILEACHIKYVIKNLNSNNFAYLTCPSKMKVSLLNQRGLFFTFLSENIKKLQL